MLPADPASRAGSTPEASSDWSSGTFAKNMSLRSVGDYAGMKRNSEGSMISDDMARVRVRSGGLLDRRRQLGGPKLRVDPLPAIKHRGIRPSSEQNIFPVMGQGRAGIDRHQQGMEDGGIQSRRPLRNRQKCEQTRAANTHPQARQMLIPLRGHLACPRPGAADEGR